MTITGTKSIQEMQRSLVEKARQSRSVSFSGVSVLRLSSCTVADLRKQRIKAAVENNNTEEIRKLLCSGSTDLQTALVSALERVSISHHDVNILICN